MKFYLCSRWARQDELKAVREKLKQLGHEVTSRWLDVTDRLGGDGENAEQRQAAAAVDCEDIQQADALIAFTEDYRNGVPAGAARGGRHVEWGLAMAWGKNLFVVGPRENVFHWVKGATQVDNIELLYAGLELLSLVLSRQVSPDAQGDIV